MLSMLEGILPLPDDLCGGKVELSRERICPDTDDTWPNDAVLLDAAIPLPSITTRMIHDMRWFFTIHASRGIGLMYLK
jgi:hypothetical protein